TIPQATFQQCLNLKCIHIGSATSLIGEYAFDGCPLSDIYISAEIPPVCYNATFNSSYPLLTSCTLHVPESSLARYKAHDKWGKFENITK
ncbi:MAG: leucine-rich repeat protein, partial [Prevotellaceae bacterium]|nr:leucine-rich repeat protein [Prevotellaceae bacterium]